MFRRVPAVAALLFAACPCIALADMLDANDTRVLIDQSQTRTLAALYRVCLIADVAKEDDAVEIIIDNGAGGAPALPLVVEERGTEGTPACSFFGVEGRGSVLVRNARPAAGTVQFVAEAIGVR